MRKALVLSCTALMAATLLSGCRSSNELNVMSLVMGIAIDKGGRENEYEVTAQIAQPTAHLGGGESSGASENSGGHLNITRTGVGVSAAMHEISQVQSRKLYTGHIQLVIISREVAKDGIGPILDYFIGSADGRLSTTLLIAGGSAKALLEGKSKTKHSPAAILAGLIEARVKAGEINESTMLAYLDDMVGGLTAPIIPVVEMKKDKNGGEQAELTGAAVFDGTRLREVMTTSQSQAVLAVRNQISGGFQKVEKDGKYLTLHVEKASSRVHATVEDGRPKMTVMIYREYSVDDSTLDIDYLNNSGRHSAEQILKAQTLEQLQKTLAWAKEQRFDAFGFGEFLYRHHNRETQELLRNWSRAFPELEVNFEIDVTILGAGAILKSLEPVNRWRE